MALLEPDAQLPCGCPRTHFGQCAAGGFGLRYALNLPGCRQGRHHHPEARIILSLRSGFDTAYAGQTYGVGDSTAFFRPAGEDHMDRYPVPTATLALLLPPGTPAESLRRPFMMRDSAFARLAELLRQEMPVPDSASAMVMEGLAWLAAAKVMHARPLEEKGATRWVAVVRERIEAEFAAPPTLADLGRMVNRDAAHVAATFKRVYGNSVGQYLRQLRLWQARRCIDAEPESTLSEVALRCGFSDQSHFTREFRRWFSLTPGQYRRRYGLPQPAFAPQSA